MIKRTLAEIAAMVDGSIDERFKDILLVRFTKKGYKNVEIIKLTVIFLFKFCNIF